MSTAPPYDAILIGAGMSGLAAGIRLAQFDRRVLIVERHWLWGGLNSFYKREGRRLDVGLHALTNYVPKGTRGAPLTKILRQLRLRHEDLALGEQSWSELAFPGARLRFGNDLELLRSEVARVFPGEIDAFERLVREVLESDPFDERQPVVGARERLGEILGDPLLVELLMLPLCYYGSAREHDVDWYQAVILFRSLFLEGFARPEGGIKPMLDLLVARFREEGGELRLRAPVKELLHDGARCLGVRLESGEEILAGRVLSSAGYGETLALFAETFTGELQGAGESGDLSFIESILVLDSPCAELGHEATIVFFNDAETFDYRRPAALTDPRSGVFCTPDNYATVSGAPPREGIARLTTLADHARWCALDEEAYRTAKFREVETALDVAARYAFDPRPHAVWRDTFTPRTIEHFTGRIGGAVYGNPRKRLDGSTPLEHLHLIGADQGYLGVTGAMLSGISIANRILSQQPTTSSR